jgi:hypothetical protein
MAGVELRLMVGAVSVRLKYSLWLSLPMVGVGGLTWLSCFDAQRDRLVRPLPITCVVLWRSRELGEA